MNREDLYLKIAELHLRRVDVLQTVEWRITLSIWTFIAGVAMVSLANADKVKHAAVAIGHYGPAVIFFLIFAIYGVLLYLYVYRFSKENYNSLVTERNRYQRMQNEAIKLVLKDKSVDFLIRTRIRYKQALGSGATEPSFEYLSGDDFKKSGIWLFKAVTTTALMVFSLAIIAMILFSAGENLNDSVTATCQPVRLQLQSFGGNVSREAD